MALCLVYLHESPFCTWKQSTVRLLDTVYQLCLLFLRSSRILLMFHLVFMWNKEKRLLKLLWMWICRFLSLFLSIVWITYFETIFIRYMHVIIFLSFLWIALLSPWSSSLFLLIVSVLESTLPNTNKVILDFLYLVFSGHTFFCPLFSTYLCLIFKKPLFLKQKYICVSHSVWFFATPWTVACQVPLSMEFSRQDYWGELPFPSPANLSDPGIETWSPTLQADFYHLSPQGSPNYVSTQIMKIPVESSCKQWSRLFILESQLLWHYFLITRGIFVHIFTLHRM